MQSLSSSVFYVHLAYTNEMIHIVHAQFKEYNNSTPLQ